MNTNALLMKNIKLTFVASLFVMVVSFGAPSQDSYASMQLFELAMSDSLSQDCFDKSRLFMEQGNSDSAIYYMSKCCEQDPTNVKLLYDRAYYVAAFKDSEQALPLYRHAIRLTDSVSSSDTSVIANLYQQYAAVLLGMDCFDSSYFYYQKAIGLLSNYSSDSKKYELSLCYNSLAFWYMRQKYFSPAKQYFLKALQIQEEEYESTKDEIVADGNVASTCMNLAMLYGLEENYDSAFLLIDRSIRLRENVKNSKNLHGSYYNKAELLKETGRYEEAIAYYRKAMRLRESQYEKGHDALNQIYTAFGIAKAQMGEMDSAVFYTSKAIESLEIQHEHNKNDLVDCYLNLSRMYVQQSEFAQAMASLQTAIGIEESDDKTQRVNVLFLLYNTLSGVYYYAEDYDGALGFVPKLLELAEGSDSNTITVYSNAGRLLANKGDFELALSNLLLAETIYEQSQELDQYDGIVDLYDLIAEVYKALDQSAKVREYQMKAFHAVLNTSKTH